MQAHDGTKCLRTDQGTRREAGIRGHRPQRLVEGELVAGESFLVRRRRQLERPDGTGLTCAGAQGDACASQRQRRRVVVHGVEVQNRSGPRVGVWKHVAEIGHLHADIGGELDLSFDHLGRIVTVPAEPSTSIMSPSVMRSVAPVTLTAQGIPSSRDTMIAWLINAPTLTTTAAAGRKSGVHAGSVNGATRTSPGSRPLGSAGSSTTRARPLATPEHPLAPRNTVPTAALSKGLARAASISSIPGTSACELMKNGGSTAAKRSRSFARSRIVLAHAVGSTRHLGNSSNGSSRATSRGSSHPPPSTMRRASSKYTC